MTKNEIDIIAISGGKLSESTRNLLWDAFTAVAASSMIVAGAFAGYLIIRLLSKNKSS